MLVPGRGLVVGVVSWSRDVDYASGVMLFSFFSFCAACARVVGCWLLFVL